MSTLFVTPRVMYRQLVYYVTPCVTYRQLVYDVHTLCNTVSEMQLNTNRKLSPTSSCQVKWSMTAPHFQQQSYYNNNNIACTIKKPSPLFVYLEVTVDTEAGMTIHSQH